MIQLVSNESIVHEETIGIENLTITDKRILYSNGINNAFIGINELRGAELGKESVKTYGVDINMEVLLVWSALISFLCVEVYYLVLKNSLLAGLFQSFFVSLIIVVLVMIIGGTIKMISSRTNEKLVFKIIRTDNSYWINQYYELSESIKLQELVNKINYVKYK